MSLIKEIELDFNLTKNQLECLEIHNIFKQNGGYEKIEGRNDFDKAKVYYNCEYNDNWYDLKPICIDLIKDNKVFDKVSMYLDNGNAYGEVNYRNQDASEGDMLSFIITKENL